MIKIKNLTKKYNEEIVLEQVDFEIKKGEVISCIGPSGSGKSTLLRCIAKLVKPDAGSIEPKNLRVGMVFQNFNLFANKSVLENITLAPILVDKLKKGKAERIAIKLLDRVGLKDKKDCFPSQLSGGQMQRIAIIRAIARKPDIMLFDEPTSALDPELSYEVLGLIKELVLKDNLTAMIVTHEINFAFNVSDRVLFMDKGEILFDDKPKQVVKNDRVRQFISNIG